MEIREVLSALEMEAERDGVPILRGAERQLLLEAAETVRPARILEVGTAIGFSALLMAERFPEAEIDTIEMDNRRWARAEEAVKAAGCAGRVRCHLGDAAEVIPRLTGVYDFLYLDGPKGQYLRHLRLTEPLLSSCAAVAADNVLFRGMVRSDAPPPRRYRTLVGRLRDYLAYAEARYDTVVFEEGDGLAVSRPRNWIKKQ